MDEVEALMLHGSGCMIGLGNTYNKQSPAAERSLTVRTSDVKDGRVVEWVLGVESRRRKTHQL